MKWSELALKERISYIIAFILILSGIIMGFLSFFLNAYDIATGVLIYIAQAFCFGGGLIGASVYFKSKWIELDTRAKQSFKKYIDDRIGEHKHQERDM